jgi:hypothetical protein
MVVGRALAKAREFATRAFATARALAPVLRAQQCLRVFISLIPAHCKPARLCALTDVSLSPWYWRQNVASAAAVDMLY